MKKLILSLLFPFIFACSSDDSNDNNNANDDNEAILCTSYTRQEIISNVEGYIWTATANYAGNKTISSSYTQYLSSPSSETVEERIWYKNHIYSGELEVSINTSYEVDGISTTNTVTEDFEYDDEGFVVKETRTHYDNNEISSVSESFFTWTNNNLTRQQTDANGQLIAVINLDSNNNILEEITYENGQVNNVITRTYDYSKNAQFKNVENFWVFGYWPHYPPNKPYQNPILTKHSSNNDCTLFYEHSFDENDFQISTSRRSTCNPDFVVVYNWYYD